MGLTSATVLWAAVSAAGALFAVTVWRWPRLAGRGPLPVLGRVGLLAAVQLALFAVVALAANRTFLFYGSWADLLGREQQPGVVVDHSAGRGAGAGSVRVLGRQDAPGAPGGRIEKIAVSGGESGIASPALVYLPPEYVRAGHRGRDFPAAVVLAGYPGTAESLITGLDYPRTAYRLVREGRMEPMVLVMTRPTVAPPRDTECVDVPGGPRTETFFGRDLPRAVSSAYRVGAAARSWGIIGNSTGGYCALKIAMHHPERYAAGAGLSAHYRAPEDVTTGDLFGGDQRLRNRADLLWSLDHHAPGRAPRSSFLVTTSREGESQRAATLDFIARVRPPARVSSIILDSGGHNFTTWRREVPPALEWLGGRLSAG
ncbi:alpha/beta hydrolase-fold protein [Streptomyces sp. NPDC046887]|uniref:alpha/beta hydrolase n=1 Tax=Streptomyces sp. NPDC046887 TaxID=3155472 RepID=UPI0033D9BD9C